MILSSTLLVVLVVGGLGLLDIQRVEQLYRSFALEKVEQFRHALRRQGDNSTRLFAQAVSGLLIDNADAEVRRLVERARTQHDGLVTLYVLDRNRGVIAHSDPARYGTSHPPVAEASWRHIVAAWQRNQQQGGASDLVSGLELADGGADPLMYFAAPVFVGAAQRDARAALAAQVEDRLGYVVLGYSLAPIREFARDSRGRQRAAVLESALHTAAIGLLFIALGGVLAVVQGLGFSRPLTQLATQAELIASGNMSARVAVRSRDEIGRLGHTFNAMADRVAVLLERQASQITLEKELAVARSIQSALVPSAEPIECGSLTVAGYFAPARECGGDWWTHHELDERRSLLIIGDVTGHGVPAALITATAKAACDVARATAGGALTVAQLLQVMNQAIWESTRGNLLMSCFAAIIDHRQRQLSYASAGHNFPLLCQTSRHQISSLVVERSPSLGEGPEHHYAVSSADLEPGDALVLYTDGLIDHADGEGRAFGLRRLRDSILRAAHLPAGEMRDRIVRDLDAHSGDVRHDDVTLVVARLR